MDNLNNNLKERNLLLASLLIGGFIIAVVIIIILIVVKETQLFPSGNPPSPTPTITKTPTPTIPLGNDYSKIDELKPGVSTLDEIIKINGRPESLRNEGNKTYLFYSTPISVHLNTLVLENNKLVYSLENVFGEYRGSVAEIKSKYGEPDLVLYMQNNSYPWFIYLQQGIAIENDGKDIGAILYFIPQSHSAFTNTIAKDLKLTTEPTIEE